MFGMLLETLECLHSICAARLFLINITSRRLSEQQKKEHVYLVRVLLIILCRNMTASVMHGRQEKIRYAALFPLSGGASLANVIPLLTLDAQVAEEAWVIRGC